MLNSQPDLSGTSVEFSLAPTIEFLQSQSDFYWGGTSSTLTFCVSSFIDFTTTVHGSSVFFEDAGTSVLKQSVAGRKQISGFGFEVNSTVPALLSPETTATVKTKGSKNKSSFYVKSNNAFIKGSTNVCMIGIMQDGSLTALAPSLPEATKLTQKFLNTATEEYFIGFATGIDCYYSLSDLGYVIGGVENLESLESNTSLLTPATIECNESTPDFTATTKAGSGQDFAYFDMIYLKNSKDVLFLGSVPNTVFLYTDKNTCHKADLSVKQVVIKQELSWQQTVII